MRLRTSAVAAAVALVGVTGCLDPVLPGGGTPTLDDAGVGSVASVTVGGEHSCALTAAGDAYCWGSNEYGQLGVPIGATRCARDDRNIPCEPSPRPVTGGVKFQRLAAGANHVCGVALSGRISCWGDNQWGQLGDPATAFAVAPQLALTTALFSDVVAGEAHTCALRTDGAPVCWGSNDMGQLGVSTANLGTASPLAVPTSLRFAALTAGARRTCGRQSDGTTYCWGAHWVIRSSAGVEVIRTQGSPSRLTFSPPFRQLSAGGQTTCALTFDGAAWCWEANPAGAMGDGTRSGSLIAQPVQTDQRFTSISVGADATCAVADTGLVYCWGGADEGQLGVSALTVPRCPGTSLACFLTPNKTSGWRSYAAVALGVGKHACGLTLAGNVYCWGAGTMGQQGDGSSASRWWPTRARLP